MLVMKYGNCCSCLPRCTNFVEMMQNGWVPLTAASYYGSTKVISWLLRNKCDLGEAQLQTVSLLVPFPLLPKRFINLLLIVSCSLDFFFQSLTPMEAVFAAKLQIKSTNFDAAAILVRDAQLSIQRHHPEV